MYGLGFNSSVTQPIGFSFRTNPTTTPIPCPAHPTTHPCRAFDQCESCTACVDEPGVLTNARLPESSAPQPGNPAGNCAAGYVCHYGGIVSGTIQEGCYCECNPPGSVRPAGPITGPNCECNPAPPDGHAPWTGPGAGFPGMGCR